MVIAFFAAERDRHVDAMISAGVLEDDKRRAAALKLQALNDLKSHLTSEAALGRKQQEKAKAHG
ncbi:hypothetical protein [Hyphomicrobium sp. DMF-1]|uniref:hypothetical protein n=1 Tax=Hyphomicrobium sp. DMF-1 TaxID=3019544 RepID=UPI0022EBFE5C|nr:hypothetical protein [Hyphomicrobium sp. DMF-1]WBT40159.1 hypothetical protein PE058_09835 [Hyphomicrobium sp. DMF-1]